MEEVECPVGDCDYSGEPSSVEAHISSSKGEHSGKAGSEYRSELQEGSPEQAEQEASSGESEPGTTEEGPAKSVGENKEEKEEESSLLGLLLIGGVALVVAVALRNDPSSNSGVPPNV